MFGRIRRAILRRIDTYAANLDASLALAADKVRDAYRRSQDLEESNEELRKAIEFYNVTRQQAENELTVLESNFSALTEERNSLAEQLKSADAAAQTLREELAAERAELAEVRHELERTGKQLELASQENRLLSEIHETDFQRRRKEKELEITQSELAIAEARRYTSEQQLEAA